jgi:hypothetical protein
MSNEEIEALNAVFEELKTKLVHEIKAGNITIEQVAKLLQTTEDELATLTNIER